MADREQDKIRKASEKHELAIKKAQLVFEDSNVIHVDFGTKQVTGAQTPAGWNTLENAQ